MRVAFYFLISLSLHAAALAYPVSFSTRQEALVMRVTIVPTEQGTSAAGGSTDNEKPAPRSRSKADARAQVSTAPLFHRESAGHSEPQAISTESSPTPIQGLVELASTIPSSSEIASSAESSANSIDGEASGSGASRGGNTTGSHLLGTGLDSGAGTAEPGSAGKTVLSQARYRDTPRPNYPENARREGREGRVLLRVLVDNQGRSKQVQINSSSGSEALDHAAAEAIRRWRFYPARHGDQPVESWLRIPIEFRLADAASR